MLKKSNPKTIEDWRKERRKKAGREGGFILIPMELWNGEAFHTLSKSEKLILIEALSQLRYAPNSKRKREAFTDQRILKCGLGHLLNNGEFGLPTKYLQERGIKGEDTISNAKKRLVEIGFLDVVVQGSFTKAARFRYSDRWRTYHSGEVFKEKGEPEYDGPMPGYCHYPNIIQFNERRRAEQPDCADDPIQVTIDDADTQLDLFAEDAGVH